MEQGEDALQAEELERHLGSTCHTVNKERKEESEEEGREEMEQCNYRNQDSYTHSYRHM